MADQWRRPKPNQAGSKWFNAPVIVSEGSLALIRRGIPDFERRSLGVLQPNGVPFCRINERLDLILRKPCADDPHIVPIGAVSKEYRLVTHKQVVDAILRALSENKISDAWAEATVTEYGERMHLGVFLPAKYEFDPGDGHVLAMRLECFNSVEGSTKFRVFIGWFRLICENGLIIGALKTNFEHRHTSSLSIEDIGAVLSQGFAHAERDRNNLTQWVQTPITRERIIPWVEGPLLKTLGFKAATRTYHIALSCHDVNIAGPYKDNTPITIPVEQTILVPGARRAENAYDVSQALAWLARQRTDLQEQLTWREQIPGLIGKLIS